MSRHDDAFADPAPASPDDGFEQLVRFRLHQLADHAPTTVRSIDEIRVQHANRPSSAHRRRGRHRRTAGIGATLAALLGAAGFATVALTGAGTAGAASPEDAAAQFLDAMGDEDVFGMVDALDPSEVEVVRGGLREVRAEAVGADVVSEGFSLDDLAGVDLAFDDLSFTTAPLVDGVTVVEAAGALSWSFDPATFPAGAEIEGVLGEAVEGSSDLSELGVSPVVVTVERDGRWFVSASYTLLEWARGETDLAAPSTVLPAVGAASPEQAASSFLGGLVAGDVERAFSITPPGEGDAVRTYAPILAAELEQSMEGAPGADMVLGLSDVVYSVEGSGSRRWLTPTSFTISGTVPEPVRFDVYDPDLPTIITSSDGMEYYLLPAGVPIPATLDGLEPVAFDDLPTDLTNYTFENEVGRVEQLEPAPVPGGPDPIEIVYADGCTTVSGPGIEGALGLPVEVAEPGDPLYGMTYPGGYEQVSDDVWRICPSSSSSPFAALSLVIGAGSAVVLDLPSIEVVEVDGAWYVSPAGSVLGTLVRSLADVTAGGSLLDSDLGPFLIGTNRESLELVLVGTYVAELTPECGALVVGDDVATGLRDDITTAQARSCYLGPIFSSAGALGVDGPTVVGIEPGVVASGPSSSGFEFGVPASTLP